MAALSYLFFISGAPPRKNIRGEEGKVDISVAPSSIKRITDNQDPDQLGLNPGATWKSVVE